MVVTKPVPKQNSTTKAKSKSKKKPTESVLSFFAPSSALAIKNKLKPISPKQSKLSFKSDVNGKARNKTCIVLEDEGEEEDVEAEERDSDIEIVDSTELKRMVRRRSPSSSPLIAMDTNHMVEALSSQVVIVEEGDRVEKDMFQREALLLEEEMPEEHDQSKEELNEWNDDGEEGRELEYNEDGENVEGDEDDDGWGDEEMDRNVEDGGEELAEEIRREVGMQEDVDEDEVEITEGVKRCPICSISLYSFTQTVSGDEFLAIESVLKVCSNLTECDYARKQLSRWQINFLLPSTLVSLPPRRFYFRYSNYYSSSQTRCLIEECPSSSSQRS